jgi:hypothetical protein
MYRRLPQEGHRGPQRAAEAAEGRRGPQSLHPLHGQKPSRRVMAGLVHGESDVEICVARQPYRVAPRPAAEQRSGRYQMGSRWAL